MHAKTASRFAVLMLLWPLLSHTQSTASASASACPLELLHINPSTLSVNVKNDSGKTIVGLVFHVALADAAEHWKWLHWDFDQSRPLRDFGWNKSLKPGVIKKLGWGNVGLDFEHGGGGAFVLTSALLKDGATWEDSSDSASCKILWHHNHKKTFSKPIVLPPREP
jgi:hypothetical protein